MKLQAFRPSDPKSLQSQIRSGAKNQLSLNGLDTSSRTTNYSELSPDQAIEVAKTSEPDEPRAWSPEAKTVGLGRGDWVSVTPDDYGNPVYGSLISWADDEIVLRHEDPSVGQVNLRLPRVGFDAARTDKRAA